MKGFFSGWKAITLVSYGLVYTMFTMWLFFNLPLIVEADKVANWSRIIIGYAVLNMFVFANSSIRNKLFDVKLSNFLPRVLIFWGVGLIAFSIILSKVNIEPVGIINLIKGVPLWVLIIHAFVFATTESALWQGYLDQKIGHPASEISAGLFHLSVWQGPAILVVLGAGLLFMLFSYVNYKFKNGSKDLAPAIGTHTAYNFVKLGVGVI